MTSEYEEDFVKSYDEVYLEPIEEPVGIKKIKENYLFFILISAIFGVLCTACLYKNLSGITVPLFSIAWMFCCVAALNKLEIKISKISYVYMGVIMLLSIATIFTTSSFSLLFNGVGIFVLVYMILQGNFYESRNWRLDGFIIGMLNMGIQLIVNIFAPFTHLSVYRKGKINKENKFKYVMIGLGISIPLVIMVLILLISADSIFSSMFTNVFEKINFEDIFGISLMFCLGSMGFYAVLLGFASKNLKNELIYIKKGEPVIAITFTSILAVVYLVFCLIQIRYLFIGGANALPEAFTYAEYARKGFFQLVFVSIINLALVLICIRVFRESKVLKVVLLVISACTYIMIASSAYRMVLYVEVYHLTFLRVLVLWFLPLLTLLMTGIIVTIFNKKFNMFRFSFIVVISFYIVFSYAKPDRIIAEYNINHIDTFTYSDVVYMVDELSYDAAPVISRIDLSKVRFNDDIYKGDGQSLNKLVNDYFERVKEDYDARGIRGFNFSSFEADKVAH